MAAPAPSELLAACRCSRLLPRPAGRAAQGKHCSSPWASQTGLAKIYAMLWTC